MRPILLASIAAALVAATCAPAGAVAFARADANHDGFVTYEEAVRVFPRLAPVHFRKSDPDGDGVIDQGEFPLLNDLYWLMYKT
jgi:hypothetical protein